MTKLFPNQKQWKKWSLPAKLTAIGTYITIIMAILYFFDKGAGMSKSNSLHLRRDTVFSNTVPTNNLSDKGIVSKDDFDWPSDSLTEVRSKYCEALYNEHLFIVNPHIKDEGQFLYWIVGKYFGRSLSGKDSIKIFSNENDLMIKIFFEDKSDFLDKTIQIGLGSIIKGKIDRNNSIDYIIPFYTSAGLSNYYCQLLFVINDKDSTRAFRNCRIELDNYHFSLFSLEKGIVSVITYNHNDGDAWCCPSKIDTLRLKYFNDKVIFTQ